MQILIVEDDNDSRILLESILESRDYDIISTRNGLEAIKWLENNNPNLIISDILMPFIDGFELCKKIKSNSKWAHIPIIIYSATYVETRDRELAIASGAHKFLLKPIDPMTMLEEVADSLAKNAQQLPQFSMVANEVDALHIRVLQDKLQAKIEVISQKNHQLELEQELLELTLNVTGMIAFRWYPETDSVISSDSLFRLLFGATDKNVITLSQLINRTHQDDQIALEDAFEQLKLNVGLVHTKFRLLTPNNETIQLSLYAKQHIHDPLLILGLLLNHNDAPEESINLFKTRHELSPTDPSTSLPNRNGFLNALQQSIANHQLVQKPFCILLLNLDNFRTINQGLGHDYGEKLMQAVAERLKTIIPSTFSLFRVGGDEFAIILNQLGDAVTAVSLAKKILQSVSQTFELKGQYFNVTTSIGVCQYPNHSNNLYGLLTALDNAIYKAKSQLGNTVILYQSGMSDIASERMLLSTHLLKAIEKNQLELYYQPKVNTATGRITGVEALLRWKHPSWGMVMPDKFISLAEQNGHIIPIGRWVFRQALTEPFIKTLVSEGASISINLSVRQFVDELLIDFLRGLLSDTKFPANSLILEITESTLQVAPQSIYILQQIKALGIKIAIDDFGTGYSSFGSLKQIQLDVLKIDKLFINDITVNKTDYHILKALIKLAEALNMTTTAEGVEEEQQLAIIKELGCNEYQGFYFSRPLPIKDLETFVRNLNH